MPVFPTVLELANWNREGWIPGLPKFNVIYAWAVVAVAVAANEYYRKHMRRLEWLAYWIERGRVLAGNMDEIGQVIVGRKVGGAQPASPDRIAAGVLQQTVDIVNDLLPPAEGCRVMSCMLVPILDGEQAVALQATAYNQNVGRNKSRIALDTPGPAQEAFRTGRVAVVADTAVGEYRRQFEGRPYRSVIAYPIRIGGDYGRVLAIVCLDATEAGHFTQESRVDRGIDAAIIPCLKLIALLRIAEMKGGRRGRQN